MYIYCETKLGLRQPQIEVACSDTALDIGSPRPMADWDMFKLQLLDLVIHMYLVM